MFKSIRSSRDAVFLIITGFLFFYLRFPSLYEPYWYGDEGIYFTIGRALRAGQTLYAGIWDNKPPLLYWFYAIFNDLFSIRFVSIIFGLLAVIAFFYVSRKLFPPKNTAYVTTFLFSLIFALPTIEGNIANAENFMLLPIIAGAFVFWYAEGKELTVRKHSQLLLISGLLLGIAFLFKTVTLFDFLAFLSFSFFQHYERKTQLQTLVKRLLPRHLSYFIGFLLPLGLVSIVFLLQGNLFTFLDAMFLHNVSYVGEKNILLIPQGFLLLKLVLLGLSLFGLFRIRKRLTPKSQFIILWIAFSLFNAFFSQRPYVHYQIVLIPSLSLLVGLILTEHAEKLRLIFAVGLITIISVLYLNFPHWNTTRVIPYYRNFISYLNGQKSLASYQLFFDKNTARDYAIADYLRMHTKPNERVFLWGDSAQIYYLSHTLPAGRYTVSYHMSEPQTINDTQKLLGTNPPKLLLILPGTEPFPFMTPNYRYRLTLVDTAIYERLD